MQEGIPNIPKKETHLKEGIKPIMVCIGTKKDDMEVSVPARRSIPKSAYYVDFYSDEEKLKEGKFLNAGKKTYVMSPVDNMDKFSDDFFDCTSLIMVGKDKKSGEDISFMTHQNPDCFLVDKKDNFVKDLQKRISDMRKKCEQGTIDSVIIGGNFNHLSEEEVNNILKDKSEEEKQRILEKIEKYHKNYAGSINLLSDEIKNSLGFEPVVVNGPKNSRGPDFAFFDTKNRRLYFERPKLNTDTRDFTASTMENERGKWGEHSH